MQYPKLQEKDEMNFPSANEDPGRDRRLSLLAKLYFEIEISHFMCLVRNTKTKMLASNIKITTDEFIRYTPQRCYAIIEKTKPPRRAASSAAEEIFISVKNFRYWSLPATRCYTTQDKQMN